jgi:hypothetical protein
METRFEIGDKSYFIKIEPSVLNEAKKFHSVTFRKALDEGALLRKALMNYMIDQKVWSTKKEAQYQEYIKKINDLEYKLSAGAMKVSEGRKLAIELAETRAEFRDLIAERNIMDSNTAEGQADNARFNFMLAKCVYDYATQKPVYSSLEDYLQNGDDDVAIELASRFANYLYNIDDKYEENLVENKFLKRFKLIDDKGRYIDKDGNYVDIDGNRIDEEGYRLDEEGNRIDMNGHPLDVNIDTAEFIEG